MSPNFFRKMKKNHDITEEKPLANQEEQENVPAQEQQLPGADQEENSAFVKMEAELSDSRDKYLRLLSEFENFKKRNARDRSDMIKMAAADTLLAVLPVLDDLERAVRATAEKGSKQEDNGIVLIYNKLKSILEGKGLKAMVSEGQTFDADLHDAISIVPPPADDMKGKVLQEIEKGYFLNDKVVRHAKVIVCS
jgi:molecular chaperone GrpE